MNEIYRPQFHFTAPKGWLNDPNGLVFYQGEYHLFYQHNPDGTDWIPDLSWGHAVSRDLVRWTHLPPAISPMPLPGGGRAGAWSGSGVVDWENSAGLQTGSEPPVCLFWTATGLGQCMAYSNDRGRTFTPYAGNPVLPMGLSIAGDWDRDPKVFWHAASRKWVMVISCTERGFLLYGSTNLLRWTFMSLVEGLWECPDMYELLLDGDPRQPMWILQDASSKYLIGRFDGVRFTPESGPFRLDLGPHYYAAQSWSDLPDTDGRRVSIAWMRGGQYPGMPFNQQMGIPSELELRTLPEGPRLVKQPVRELALLRREPKRWKNSIVEGGTSLLVSTECDACDIEAEIELAAARQVGFYIRGARVTWSEGTLTCLDQQARVRLQEGRLNLRILVDRTSIEIYANEGAASFTFFFLPEADDSRISFFADGPPARLRQLRYWNLSTAGEPATSGKPLPALATLRAWLSGGASVGEPGR